MVPIHSTPRASKASDSTLSEGRPFPTSADALNRTIEGLEARIEGLMGTTARPRQAE